jgi:PufQ cytochrome subunit
MSDQSADGQFSHGRTPRAEFNLYLGIIFLAALVLTSLTYPIRLILPHRTPLAAPLAQASRVAAEITPMIFRP